MAVVSSHPAGVFSITKTRLILALSVVITWWFAHILPHYQPYIRAELSSRLQEARQSIPSIKVDWKPSNDPRSHFNGSKVALLIEPRPIPHLVPQILHMISVVPPDWRFLFIGSNQSVASVGRSYATKHQQVIGKLDLMILPEPWNISTKENVFRTLTDMRFYDEFLPDVEWILKYESDSILCSNSESSLNDWLHWSWAGAPRTPDDRFSGNGGLSLRRVSAIRKVLEFQVRYNDSEAEDEWFGKRLWVLPGEKVASGSDGILAVEDVFMEAPMGYHLRDGGQGINDAVWKNPEQRKKIFSYCPEISMIMDMKLERERCTDDNMEGGLGPTEAQKQRMEEEEAARKAQEEVRQQEEARKQEEQERQRLEEQRKAEAERARIEQEMQREAELERQRVAAGHPGQPGAVPNHGSSQLPGDHPTSQHEDPNPYAKGPYHQQGQGQGQGDGHGGPGGGPDYTGPPVQASGGDSPVHEISEHDPAPTTVENHHPPSVAGDGLPNGYPDYVNDGDVSEHQGEDEMQEATIGDADAEVKAMAKEAQRKAEALERLRGGNGTAARYRRSVRARPAR